MRLHNIYYLFHTLLIEKKLNEELFLQNLTIVPSSEYFFK